VNFIYIFGGSPINPRVNEQKKIVQVTASNRAILGNGKLKRVEIKGVENSCEKLNVDFEFNTTTLYPKITFYVRYWFLSCFISKNLDSHFLMLVYVSLIGHLGPIFPKS
jgi:hypothetical protein